MSAIDEPLIGHLAQLSRLALSEGESAAAAVEIERIRAYIARIQAIQLPSDAPAGPFELESAPLRPDRAEPGLDRDLVLAAAPRSEDGCFVVPKVLEGSGR